MTENSRRFRPHPSALSLWLPALWGVLPAHAVEPVSAAVPASATLAPDWAGLGYVRRQNPADLAGLPRAPSCQGGWLPTMPVLPGLASLQDSPSELQADRLYHDPESGSELTGHVELNQPGRRLQADRLTLDRDQRLATATGHVRLSQNGLTSDSEALSFDLQQQTGLIEHTRYASSILQAHGEAQSIVQRQPGQLQLNGLTYTTCDPVDPLWSLQAARLDLNQAQGRAVARSTTLRVRQVPVLYLPWFEFPTDDRRSTGLLLPKFGYTNSGGVDLSVPYYFNLAPNYDLTLTPRLISDRGTMLEGEARWLAPQGIDTLLRGGILPSDEQYRGDTRKQASLRSRWQASPAVTYQLSADYLSDKDYFADLGNDPLVRTPSYQERSLSMLIHDWVPGLNGVLRVQDFRVVDRSLPDAQRPYQRLPQLLLSYAQGSGVGWSWSTQHDLAYFKKPIDDGSVVERSGLRLYQQLGGQYRWQNSWGYVQPALSARHLYTYYDRASQTSQGIDRANAGQDVLVPQFSLDSGLVFERSGRYQQFLEPRLFYAYAPYRNQDRLPSFDTVGASFSYSQLFSPYRFIGHDRLEDNHVVALGLTHRLYAADGIERIRTSVGQQFLLADRRVRLDSTQPPQSRQVGPALDLSVHLSEGLHLESTTLWQASGQTAQSVSQLIYDDHRQTYQLGWFSRRPLPEQNQQALHQLTLGVLQPINSQWRLFGSLQYDTDRQLWRDYLLGADYDSCCVRVSLYGRRYYNDLDDPQSSTPRRAIMAELTLKGLGGLSGNLAALLRQKILGYSQVDTTWNSR